MSLVHTVDSLGVSQLIRDGTELIYKILNYLHQAKIKDVHGNSLVSIKPILLIMLKIQASQNATLTLHNLVLLAIVLLMKTNVTKFKTFKIVCIIKIIHYLKNTKIYLQIIMDKTGDASNLQQLLKILTLYPNKLDAIKLFAVLTIFLLI